MYVEKDKSNQDKYFLTIISQLKNNEEFVRNICSYLNKGDIQLAYQTSSFLINMTFLDEGETLIAVNFSAVNQISEFIAFATMDKNLFTNALFLVNNITFSSKKVCAFFIKNKLISFFAHTYDSYSLFEEISEFMVKCLVNLLNNCGCRENIEAFKDIFPIIKPKLL